MYLLVYILPIINILLCNRYIGQNSNKIGIINTLMVLLLCVIIWYEKQDIILIFGNWVNIDNLDINWCFRFDK